MRKETSSNAFPCADWQGLLLRAERCYQGPPAGRSGTFPGTVLTLCQLLRGEVAMRHAGSSIHAAAGGAPEWIVNIPGKRTQHFSEDAQIISVHLSIGGNGNGAQWLGKPLTVVPTDAPARTALRQLQKAVAAAGFSVQQLELNARSLPLPEALAVQAASTLLFQHLLRLLRPQGMRFEVPAIDEPRVRETYQALSEADYQQPFSRDKLAAAQGISAGQLDRLWREQLGTTPFQYRERLRLSYACQQLRRRDIPIKVIAANLGFRHLSQFSNWFTAQHNESPSHFRGRPESA